MLTCADLLRGTGKHWPGSFAHILSALLLHWSISLVPLSMHAVHCCGTHTGVMHHISAMGCTAGGMYSLHICISERVVIDLSSCHRRG